MNKNIWIKVIIGLIVLCLFYYYRIFFSPLQILSIREIEKNKQGICLAENRKLSEDELLNRGMQSYFNYLKTEKIPQDESWEVMLEHCRENCVVTQLANYNLSNYNLLDYLRLRRLNFKEKDEQINSFPLTELKQHVNFKNKQDNLFSLYINQNRRSSFYPNDCCEVNTLDFYTQNGFSLKNMPTDWRSIGKGNFYLAVKYLSMSASDGTEVDLNYDTMPLDNCGNIYREYFNENEGGRDFKNPNITDFKVFLYRRKHSIVSKEILENKCILLSENQIIFPHFFERYEFVSYNNQSYFCSDKWDW